MSSNTQVGHDSPDVVGDRDRLVVGDEDAGQAPFPVQLAKEREDLVKGPPADKALDKDGKTTQAGLGFAKKNNIDPSSLEVREEGNNKYVFAQVKQANG